MTLYYHSAEHMVACLIKLKFTEKDFFKLCLSRGSYPLCLVRKIYSEVFALPITHNYHSSVSCFGGSKMAVIYFFVRQLTNDRKIGFNMTDFYLPNLILYIVL